MIRILLALLLLPLALEASARQLVLVQGYLGHPSSWSESGVTQQLIDSGWRYGGEFIYTSDGAQLFSERSHWRADSDTVDTFYSVSLPTEASIKNQAFYLTSYLKALRQWFAGDEIVLAGHSAGGVVARYSMVRNPGLGIDMLITIASPHLGSDSAELGALVGESPLAVFAPMLGVGTITRSQGLYRDLMPEKPQRFLYWLNRQPHPAATYISIVRDDETIDSMDLVVPKYSQFLEQVEDLKDRAISYVVPGAHGLSAEDGRLLIELVQQRVIRAL